MGGGDLTQQRPRGDFRRESLLKTVLNSVLGTCFNQARLDQRTQILEKRGRPTWGGRKGRSIIKGSHAQGVASAQQQDVCPLTEERAVESFRSWRGVSWPRHLNDGRLRPGTRQRPSGGPLAGLEFGEGCPRRPVCVSVQPSGCPWGRAVRVTRVCVCVSA